MTYVNDMPYLSIKVKRFGWTQDGRMKKIESPRAYNNPFNAHQYPDNMGPENRNRLRSLFVKADG